MFSACLFLTDFFLHASSASKRAWPDVMMPWRDESRLLDPKTASMSTRRRRGRRFGILRGRRDISLMAWSIRFSAGPFRNRRTPCPSGSPTWLSLFFSFLLFFRFLLLSLDVFSSQQPVSSKDIDPSIIRTRASAILGLCPEEEKGEHVAFELVSRLSASSACMATSRNADRVASSSELDDNEDISRSRFCRGQDPNE